LDSQVVRMYGSNQPANSAGIDQLVSMVVSLEGNSGSGVWGGRELSVSPTVVGHIPRGWYNQPCPEVIPTASNATGQSVQTSAPVPVAGGVSAAMQQALNLLNADRAASGLPPVRMSLQLNKLADNYAHDLIARHFFAHNNPEGQSPFDRMRQQGIPFGYAGENLAINTGIPSAEQAFMNSPGHRANILNSHYTQVGIGVGFGPQGTVYVVQEFTDG